MCGWSYVLYTMVDSIALLSLFLHHGYLAGLLRSTRESWLTACTSTDLEGLSHLDRLKISQISNCHAAKVVNSHAGLE